MWPLRGINKAAWGTKLILTADLASPVSCASLGHLLMAQHCHLCLSAFFSPPTAPHPSPTHPLYTQSVILQLSKNYILQKPGALIQIACRITCSYEILAT